jgi:uncharacterized protein (UPF0332 family)
MKPKTCVILEMAIGEGITRGWHLAHKHVDDPSPEAIKERLEDAVMSAYYGLFHI